VAALAQRLAQRDDGERVAGVAEGAEENPHAFRLPVSPRRCGAGAPGSRRSPVSWPGRCSEQLVCRVRCGGCPCELRLA
jgi:hypothetical protein